MHLTAFQTEPNNAAQDQQESRQSFMMPIMGMVILLSLVMSFPAVAALDSSVFTNDYDDPFHPLCKRHIEVSVDGKSFQYKGTAVGSKDDPVRHGCSAIEIREYKLRRGAFEGVILEPGNRISAGDGIHEGVWEPAGTATTNLGYEGVDGIRWNDGNKWIVHQKSFGIQIGEFITFSYIGFSCLAGAKALYDGIQKNRQATE